MISIEKRFKLSFFIFFLTDTNFNGQDLNSPNHIPISVKAQLKIKFCVVMYFSTPCSTSSCTTSPYVIFETNSLPYVQRTVVTERNQSNTTSCIDDSGGGETPVDNNNIGDDENDNHGTDHILKRISASVLQRHSFEHVADNENDEDEDDTSQGKLC